jgi:hypothetical protein
MQHQDGAHKRSAVAQGSPRGRPHEFSPLKRASTLRGSLTVPRSSAPSQPPSAHKCGGRAAMNHTPNRPIKIGSSGDWAWLASSLLRFARSIDYKPAAAPEIPIPLASMVTKCMESRGLWGPPCFADAKVLVRGWFSVLASERFSHSSKGKKVYKGPLPPYPN